VLHLGFAASLQSESLEHSSWLTWLSSATHLLSLQIGFDESVHSLFVVHSTSSCEPDPPLLPLSSPHAAIEKAAAIPSF
jgi:hypothetical protein